MYFPYIKCNCKSAIYFSIILISATFQLNINNIAFADTFEEQEEYSEKLREQKERIYQLEKEIEELKLQEQIINKKKAAAQLREQAAKAEQAAVAAEKAAAGAYLPKINIGESKFQLPQGKITPPTGLTFESEILAVRAMDSVAKKIQTEIANKLGSKVSLIVSDKDKLSSNILGQFEYRTFKDKVDFFKRKYREFNVVIPPKLPARARGGNAILNPATAATASFLFDLLPIFRVDKTITEADAKVNTRDFIAQLSGKFQASSDSQISIYYPAEYPLINKNAVNDVFKEIITIRELQGLAQKKILSSANDELQDLNESVDEFIENLKGDISTHKTKSAPIGEYTQKIPLQTIISSRALELIGNANNNKTYFLSVDVLAKGSQRTTKTFLNSRLRHSGGVIVKYIIYDQNASIVLSNVHHSYTGFSKVRTSK